MRRTTSGLMLFMKGARDALDRAREHEEPEDDRRGPADGLPLRKREPARGDAEEGDQEAPAEHRVGERPERLVEPERRVPDAVEETGEAGHDESAASEGDRARHRERKRRKSEGVAEPAAELRREGDVRERDRRAEVHRVDEEVRRREEIFERMRRVPGAVPPEPDAEREDVEEDREPDKAVRRVEADAFLIRSKRGTCRCRTHGRPRPRGGHLPDCVGRQDDTALTL